MSKQQVSNDALDALQTLQQHFAEEKTEAVPDGFRTVLEWAEAWKKSRWQTDSILTAGIKSGVVERISLRVGSGRTVRFFKVKVKSK